MDVKLLASNNDLGRCINELAPRCRLWLVCGVFAL
jgi:hypothetical protein